MKLKKMIAFGLSLVLLLSLAACGKTEEGEIIVENKPTTETTTEVPTETTETTESTEEKTEETTQMTTAEKEEYYKNYITSDDFGYAGSSIRVETESFNTELMRAKDETMLLSMKVESEELILYVDKDGKQYVYAKLEDENGNITQGWFNLVLEEDETIFNITEESSSAYSVDTENVLSSRYIETVDGIDYIELTEVNEDYVEGTTYTEYKIKFNYNGEECTMRIVESLFGNSSSYQYRDINAPDDYESFDYKFDLENKKMTNRDDGKEIQFEITDTNDATPEKETISIIGVDTNTKKIVSIESFVQFLDVDTCEGMVEVGDIVGDCDVMQFAMYYLNIALLAVDETTL